MARLAQCSSMHVMEPSSAAGSAFNMIGDPCAGKAMECPYSGHGGEAVSPGYCVLHIFNRGAVGAIVATGLMKPLGGGSVRRVASDRRVPAPGCQPRHGRRSKVAGNNATDGSTDRFESNRMAAMVAASDRRTFFMEPRVGRRVATRWRQVQQAARVAPGTWIRRRE